MGERRRKMTENVWERILQPNKLPNITDFPNKIDLNDVMTIRESGKPTLEQIITILDEIEHLDNETALVLPEGFIYRVDARTVRKNVRPIALRRIRTKKEAIEQEITPEKLIKEKIEEMRARYLSNPETLRDDYAGISYKGITDRKIKNYLLSDAIEGYLHAKTAGVLIKINRYDTLESLLKSKEFKELSEEERATVTRLTKAETRYEILKIRKRKMLTEVPEKVRRIILTKQAERAVLMVPSTSKAGKFYENIKFRKLPEAFPDDKYPDLNKEFYASWTDFYTEPSCNCDDKMWFITYLRPNQIWNCVHEIAAFRKAIAMDWQGNQPITYPNPYIATSPFFKPTQKAIDYYMKERNQLFVKKGDDYRHLAKVYLDIWLEKQLRRGKLELL